MTDCQAVRAGILMRDLAQLDRDPEVATHLAGCPRCCADAALIRTATRSTAEALSDHLPLGDPAALTQTILDRAVEWRERQYRTWRWATVSAITIGIATWVVAVSEQAAPVRAALGFPDPPYVTTVPLRCVSAGDAVIVAHPYLHSPGSTAIPGPANAPSVTLQGPRDEVAQAEIAIARVDGRLGAAPAGACAR